MTSTTSIDIFILSFAYFLGSIPFGLMISWLFQLQDPRQSGSGSTGATNILRSGSKAAAFLTLLLDALKGTSAVAVALLLDPDLAPFAGMMAVIGHIWPVWLGFRGGKGVATAFGAMLMVSWPIAIACLTTWLAVALVSRYSSLSSLITGLASPLYALFLNESNMIPFCLVLAVLLMWTHRGNVGRLITGRETKIGQPNPPYSGQD